jgi:hypothetical protein
VHSVASVSLRCSQLPRSRSCPPRCLRRELGGSARQSDGPHGRNAQLVTIFRAHLKCALEAPVKRRLLGRLRHESAATWFRPRRPRSCRPLLVKQGSNPLCFESLVTKGNCVAATSRLRECFGRGSGRGVSRYSKRWHVAYNHVPSRVDWRRG